MSIIQENIFNGQVKRVLKYNLHPYIKTTLHKYIVLLKKSPNTPKHFIFYGPNGIGKYSQVLYLLYNLSPTQLIYDKKLIVKFKTKNIILRISDIHCEIDLELLGCNAKTVWETIYSHIIDVASIHKIRFIVCKHFECIHPELLEVFYFYMRNVCSLHLSFIIITNSISFIPKNILNVSENIILKRPKLYRYKKIATIDDVNEIYNMQHVMGKTRIFKNNHHVFCEPIIEFIKRPTCLQSLREMIYAIFIYHINVHDSILYIIEKLNLSREKENTIIKYVYNFYIKYYNNYRSIFHLEKLFIDISISLNEFQQSDKNIENKT